MHKGPRRNNPCVREIQYHSKITMDRVAPISMSGRDGPFVIIISHTKQKRRRRRRNNNTKNSAHCAPARHSALFFSCNSSPTRSDRLCGTQSQLQLEKETNSNNNKHNSARGTLRQARPSAESNTARLGSLFPFALYRDDYRGGRPARGCVVCNSAPSTTAAAVPLLLSSQKSNRAVHSYCTLTAELNRLIKFGWKI